MLCKVVAVHRSIDDLCMLSLAVLVFLELNHRTSKGGGSGLAPAFIPRGRLELSELHSYPVYTEYVKIFV